MIRMYIDLSPLRRDLAEKNVNCANFFINRVVLGENSKGKGSCRLNAHDDGKEEDVTDEKRHNLPKLVGKRRSYIRLPKEREALGQRGALGPGCFVAGAVCGPASCERFGE